MLMCVRDCRFTLALATVCLAVVPTARTSAADPQLAPKDAVHFLRAHCYDCHQGSGAEANLDLSLLVEPPPADAPPSSRDPLATWIQAFDRVAAGEMPPADAERPAAGELKRFLATTERWIQDRQRRQAAAEGRVRGRRLNNLQLERTLQDLLGVDIPLAKDFSDEPRTGGFTTVADGQAMSHFQLEQHLAAVDAALEEAFRRASQPADETSKLLMPRDLARVREFSRTREPEMREGLAIVWSSRLEFYGRIPATTAPEDGWYRFRVTASALKPPADGGVWCTVRSGRCVSSAPLLTPIGIFEADSAAQEWTFETWLEKGHMIEIRPRDNTLAVAKFAGGQVGTGEGESQDVSGVALHQIEMQRIHRFAGQAEIREILFGDLPVREQRTELPKQRRRDDRYTYSIEVLSDHPKADAAQQMVTFASRAFRRPVELEEIAGYVHEVEASLDQGKPLDESLLGGYRSLLCSPRFLYFQETPGRLDDYAIASRLSYLLWQSMPDRELLSLAAKGKLNDPEVLIQQSRRMLDHWRGGDFIERFADQWLDLRDIDFTEPDPRQHRDFDLIVQQSMLEETHTFLHQMLAENRSVKELIDSDYTYLNSRLARYYGIQGVEGDVVRKVNLSDSDRRGGVLTQGSILKITANGTTTSPVLRGVWIAERLLGDHIPPPPQNVPAIEPDIRGATSIREMLEKHRSDDSCAVCHVRIDPPGFALENYDPAGRWRDSYGRADKKGRENKIDASYQLADGRKFEDIDEFRELVISEPQKIAACVAAKFVTYGTGAAPRFSDRGEIKEMVEAAEQDDYGLRTILERVVVSEMFLNK